MTPEINGHTAEDLLALHIPLDGHATTPPRRSKRAAQPKEADVFPPYRGPQPPPMPIQQTLPEPALSSAEPLPSLAADVASLADTLARSLNITPTADGPKPDQFVQAVKVVHDRLAEARRSLGAWSQELEQRELALETRERAVERREQEAAALVALAGLSPSWGQPAKPRGILARLLKRRG